MTVAKLYPILTPHKRCRRCDVTRSCDQFPRSYVNRDGLDSYCHPCKTKCAQDWNRRNPEKYQARKLRHLAKRYGITPEEYAAIIARGCEVCGATEGKICLDHDHITGKPRGCLCHRCNRAIGQLGDDSQLLRRAVEYLERAI